MKTDLVAWRLNLRYPSRYTLYISLWEDRHE